MPVISTRIIAITGATGRQGGGLATAILADRHPGGVGGEFAVRALTRRPHGVAAQALAAAGAEVVAADLDDQESLTAAFTGAHGAYCVTDFFEHGDPAVEAAQIGNLARAAAAAGVRHVIWSTLQDTRLRVPLDDDRMPTLLGRYKVPHFDVKAESDHCFTDLGVPTTFLYPPFYWDNLLSWDAPTPAGDGSLVLDLPIGGARLPGIAAADIGRCAYGVFARGREFVGRSVGIAGEQLTGAQMAATLTRVLGCSVVYRPASPAAYRKRDVPNAEAMANMFQYRTDFEAENCALHDPAVARQLNPRLQTFEQWARTAGIRR